MNTNLRETILTELLLMEGWVTPERGVEMADLILETKPTMVVEIGVFGGRSLLAQGLALKANGQGRIYGIDAWKPEAALEGENEANRDWWTKNVDLHQIHRLAVEAIWKHGLDEYAVLLRCPSQFCAELFAQGIDILFIDGNHSEPASCRDVVLYLPHVRPGGYVWFDDCDWSSTQKALGLMAQQCDVVRDCGHYRLYKKR